MILFQVPYYLFIGVLKFPFVAFGKCFASLAGEPTWEPSDGVEDERDVNKWGDEGGMEQAF